MMNERQILDTLKGVIDPDIGINVVDIGLVEGVRIAPDKVEIDLIMTTPACPQTDYLKDEARRLLAEAGIKAEIAILDEPLWEPHRLSELAKRELGWDG